ncbi:excinuclease ABC subunit A [Rathayibacter tanaceti]|uniref:UvrABC system protein A n=2 Tax=Rathayibacter tanaceti TaxID=1671680 RepID=A0A162FWK9_9MICO|nr:excinuclease ABC subunit A [Rathayibacter tanaceti]KZX20630.1 UvrABC system protein A [Rathayibacter tanaceti]QHC54262.1 excinuclease ABC subunit UvrA [Rathayibacter tanaceti]TCO37940.1 excinuclease ABC subunit A [Rathayibacter tanaceti]
MSAPRPTPPSTIEVRGARVHNLRNIDVSVPLNQLVSIAGVSGSGKSSLALGVLYAEGSRRYLEGLSTYTRRRMTQAARPAVDAVEHVPAALALRQRPSAAGVRSTFGTSTELLNSLRLLYSRLGSHRCPNGHHVPPTEKVATGSPLTCPECGAVFDPPGAEDFAFNGTGACPECEGTGAVREVDESALVPDETLSVREGAVASWAAFRSTANVQLAEAFGVRIDVPFAELSAQEREFVLHGPAEQRVIPFRSRGGKVVELNVTFQNARVSVTDPLRKADSETSLQRLERFLRTRTCSACEGTRLNERARSTLVDGLPITEAVRKTLDELVAWVLPMPVRSPAAMALMADSIVTALLDVARMLTKLGLGYLSLDRPSSTLSTGERQRVQLARAVRSRTTGVLYVLDEPSIGLHPSNIDGLLDVVRGLLDDGNSVVVVDHDVQVLRAAEWMIEIGPGSGRHGGSVIGSGPLSEIAGTPGSRIAPFLAPGGFEPVRSRAAGADVFERGRLRLRTSPLHTVHALDLEIPKGRLTAVTGVSGSGKSTLVLESLVPALRAAAEGAALPAHVESVDAAGVTGVHVVDASPIGANVRSTVATYSGVLDDLRRVYAALPEAKALGYTASDFSSNTGSLRCPTCEGTGTVSLDVQFLPDVDIECPACAGTRYSPDALAVTRRRSDREGPDEAMSLPAVLRLTVEDALDVLGDLRKVRSRLQLLVDLGLGYLTLGEPTTALSGGEAQRLKLASDIDRDQRESLFVFDEPSIGLHPLDVRVLLRVLQRLIDNGATVVVIEHDLDMIADADHLIDLGPGGGYAGGRIVATGTVEEVAAHPDSVTGRFLAR